MANEVGYTSAFFAAQRDAAIAAGRHIVPILLELTTPQSVIDVGCGVGAWLSVFAEHEITDVVGLDGDYLDRSQLLFPSDRFLAVDLSQAFEIGRRFDLALSLEVAEHLPAESAPGFVESLTRLAPVVLFSAAVPGQGGIDHLNEQWPGYWATQFRRLDYEPVDAIRHRVWNNDDVVWWYAQDTLLFVAAGALEPPLSVLPLDELGRPLALVHPRMYEGAREAANDLTSRRLLQLLPAAVVRSARWRLQR